MSTLKPQRTRNTSTYFGKFDILFNGTLGTRKTPHVNLDLKYDATPMCLRPHSESRVHKVMFKKEVEGLVKLGAPEHANDSEWGATYSA